MSRIEIGILWWLIEKGFTDVFIFLPIGRNNTPPAPWPGCLEYTLLLL